MDTVPRDQQAYQTSALGSSPVAGPLVRFVDPVVFPQDLVPVGHRDIISKALEQVQAVLVEHCILGALQVDDRASELVLTDLFTGVPCVAW